MFDALRRIVRIFYRKLEGNIFLHLARQGKSWPIDNDCHHHSPRCARLMKPRLVLSILLLSLSGLAGNTLAQGYWGDLPPEERRQMRQQMREHWQQDDRASRRDEGRHRWQEVPAEDRRRLREEMREQHRSDPGSRREGRGRRD